MEELDITTPPTETNHSAALEAILFLYGEPIAHDMLARLLKISEEDVIACIAQLKDNLTDTKRGLMLLEKGDTCMLITKPQFASFLESFIKDDLKEDLTPAAVETLSLIAYFGPIMRAQIDYIRGVNSSFMLRNLLVRGLIERTNKGNAYVYEVTADFLKHMGVACIQDLPQYESYQLVKEQLFASTQNQNPQPAPTQDSLLATPSNSESDTI
jgi:segregation and condensation protein B